ncbi:hypothetical protein A2U01_0013980 [Trifolium medium]|uniref:Uncharacterized protein n=1 Tax=Trifolium medium TaxID=97028 RepID=A0A392N0C3_9FABA|nr:hypothetical protein [Trifolium medium]
MTHDSASVLRLPPIDCTVADSLAREIKELSLEQNKPVFDPECFQVWKTFLDCLQNVVQTKNDLDSSKSPEALILEDRAKVVTNTRELRIEVNNQGSKLPDLKSRKAKLKTRIAALKQELDTLEAEQADVQSQESSIVTYLQESRDLVATLQQNSKKCDHDLQLEQDFQQA